VKFISIRRNFNCILSFMVN